MYKKTHSFSTSKWIGKVATREIKSILENTAPWNSPGAEVVDVQDNKDYFDEDVDLLLTSPGVFSKIEVKGDIYTSKNIFLETWSAIPAGDFAGTRGCLYKTKADFVYYYFLFEGLLYIFCPAGAIKWLEANVASLSKHRKLLRNFNRRNGIYQTEGYAVPILTFTQGMESFGYPVERYQIKQWDSNSLQAEIESLKENEKPQL